MRSTEELAVGGASCQAACHLAAAQQLCDDTACESCMETTVRAAGDIPHCTAGE